uniref:ABC transporter domain-containing protein n=1 Tax=Heterorhabditis bacteriophora TaxID=37862 RepID=A0A1I7XIF1_HETBA
MIYRTEGLSLIWCSCFLLDVVLGTSLIILLSGYSTSLHYVFWDIVDELINELDKLISSLTKNPAGLKLNEPVNTALANFFRYHIHLWKTFVNFLRTPFLWKLVLSSAVFGFSVACAVFSDLVSLLSLHILCFDVYASRVTVQKGGREVLCCVSGLARPGELMALMGASGAGKTTLLNTLLARNLRGLHVDGKVEVNGNEIGRNITAISGYAQQEELFVGTLTVREYLTIQARLRVNGTQSKREKRVNTVLSQLGLLKCQNTRIGVIGVKKGISGGEARRLTFACELLSNPALLFCDEPTTGLDSFMAESVVQVLSKLAKSGRTVICTIHQPSSQLYLMFDRVMFLAGGRTAFLGSPRDGIEFFKSSGYPCPHNYNPADMIIHILATVPQEEEECRARISKICDQFSNGSYGRTLSNNIDQIIPGKVPQGRGRVSLPTQIGALLHRSCLDNLRNPSLARAKLMQKSIMGLFIGLLYLQTPLDIKIGVSNLNGALFYLVSELTYSTLFGILTFLPADYPLVVREYHDGIYSIFSYYFARSLSYVPLFTADGLVMLLICYWLVGFSSSFTQVAYACFICFLIEQSSSAFGVMLSTISPSYPCNLYIYIYIWIFYNIHFR